MSTPSDLIIDVVSVTGSSIDSADSRGSSLSSTSSDTQAQYVDSLANGSDHVEQVNSAGTSSVGDGTEYQAILEARQARSQFLRRSSSLFLSSENLERHNTIIRGMGRSDSFGDGLAR